MHYFYEKIVKSLHVRGLSPSPRWPPEAKGIAPRTQLLEIIF